jgi:hypothetical protein
VPALILHLDDDAVIPFELGREIAAKIEGAQFAPLQGKNHIPLAHDPAPSRILEEMRLFSGA